MLWEVELRQSPPRPPTGNVRSDLKVPNGRIAHEFQELRFRPRSAGQELVKAVLRGEISKMSDIITAVFMVVYRIRNNLFHGAKLAAGLRGQLENFRHANAVLMKALEMDLYRVSKCP
jgi:hypothetical protein